MKRLLIFIICLVFVFQCISQKYSKPIGQLTKNSCWAACTDMLTLGKINQCEAIYKLDSVFNIVPNNIAPNMSCNTNNIIDSFYVKPETPIELKMNFGFISYDRTISFKSLNNNLPLMYHFVHSDEEYHFVVLKSIEQQKWLGLQENWIKVFDPWPVGMGTLYYMSYEKYLYQNELLQSPKLLSTKNYNINLIDELNLKNYSSFVKLSDQNYLYKIDRFLKNAKLSDEFISNTGLNTKNFKLGTPIKILKMSSGQIITNFKDSLNLELIYNTTEIEDEIIIPLIDQHKIITVLTLSKSNGFNNTSWMIHRIDNGTLFSNVTSDMVKNRNNAFILKVSDKQDVYVGIIKNKKLTLYNNFNSLITRQLTITELANIYNKSK
ncbi:MAG: hypothetical protein V4683_15595 [Bacteroidota bacterium]